MRNVITHELLENSWVYIFDEYWFMGQEAILLKYGLVVRDKQVFHGLTGSQRTPRVWGVTAWYQR